MPLAAAAAATTATTAAAASGSPGVDMVAALEAMSSGVQKIGLVLGLEEVGAGKSSSMARMAVTRFVSRTGPGLTRRKWLSSRCYAGGASCTWSGG